MEKMTPEQAFNNLRLACDSFVGTKAQHIALEQSLQIVGELIPKKANSEE